ncbi:hypothetical protein WMZ97_16705 [Lentibacillus sp. N15]|uniref:hypothetical protein n=1 Tax=Lentibacillus songyuanensis TaxID=3136161 RepID=UPI0031BA4166
MLYNAVFRTGNAEIHVDRKEKDKWTITVFTIEHAVKELSKQLIMTSYREAYSYIERNFIKNIKEEIVW